MSEAAIISISTGRFPFLTSAQDTLHIMGRKNPATTDETRNKIRSICSNSEIASRHLAIPAFIAKTSEDKRELAINAKLQERFTLAIDAATPVLLKCAEQAIKNAGILAEDIDFVIFASNTAFGAPGLDSILVKRLNLPRNVQRTCLNFMGCAAGLSAMRLARDHVLSRSESNSGEKYTLVACLEISSVHATFGHDANSVITHAIFGDGVACLVVGDAESSSAERHGKFIIEECHSHLSEDMADGILVRFNDRAVECQLDKQLSTKLGKELIGWRNQSTHKPQNEFDFWCIHPGGRKILDSVQDALELSPENLKASREVLSSYGNTLSCGIFYVLDRMLKSGEIAGKDTGIAMSFSPGVGIESAVLHAMPASQKPPARLRIRRERGLTLPEWAPEGIASRIDRFDAREEDVIISTYPKSGTTWLLQIVHLLLNDGRQGDLPLNEVVGWFERDDPTELKNKPSVRIIKTHLPPSAICSTAGRLIYVARNPFDLAVSYYYHARSKRDFDFLGSWDEFFDLFLDGEVEGGDWLTHVCDGLAVASHSQESSFFCTYESLKYKPDTVIRRIAVFLKIEVTDELVSLVRDRSSLGNMKKSPLTNVAWSQERSGEQPHLRVGALGGWQSLFTKDQEERLLDRWQQFAAIHSIDLKADINRIFPDENRVSTEMSLIVTCGKHPL